MQVPPINPLLFKGRLSGMTTLLVIRQVMRTPSRMPTLKLVEVLLGLRQALLTRGQDPRHSHRPSELGKLMTSSSL